MDTEFSFNVNAMGSAPSKGKRSKRLRPWFVGEEEEYGPWSCSESTLEDEHEEEEEEEMAAHSLILLSHHLSSASTPFPTPTKRVMKKAKEFHSAHSPYRYEGEKKSSYKCKTCSKSFLSFQALGGHRASCSHTSTLLESEHEKSGTTSTCNKMRVHECPICHKVFGSGQALGGHKRTHSTPPPPMHSSATENEYELDLNMPAPLDHCYTQSEVSSAVPFSTVVRPHCNDYKMSRPFWWMTSSGKRVPSVYNGGSIADEAENEVVLGRDLGFKPDLFTVAAVN